MTRSRTGGTSYDGGELKRFLEDVRDDLDVLMDSNGNGRESVRRAVAGTEVSLRPEVVLANMEGCET